MKTLKQLFYNRQRDLLWIANSPVGKKLLDNELDLKIVQIFPHSYRLKVEKNRFIDRFFTYNRIAEKLLPILTELDLYKETVGRIEKPYEALLHYSGFERKNYPLFLHTIETFNVDTNGEGRILSTDAAYATARNASSGTTDQGNSTRPANSFNGGNYIVTHGYAPFDTSSLPNDATPIVSANSFIRAKGTGTPVGNADTDSLSVVASTQASNTALVDGDFDQVGSTKLATDLALGSWDSTSGANNDLALNATGIAAVSLTGYTPLAWRTAKDIANATPTGDNFTDMGDNTNLLSIEYSVGGGFDLTSKYW